jgi:hypothetical protein
VTDLAASLSEPFDPALLRRHDAKGITYIPISEVIARLNRVLGVGCWSHVIKRTWEAGEQSTDTGAYPAWVMCEVALTATIDGITSVHDGIGGQQVKLLRNGSGVVDLGDEYKGAMSDALKKAAQAFGVGLELARKDEALAWEAAQAPPPGWSTLEAFEARKAELAARAKALPAGLGEALRVWWRTEGLRWPLTPAQADTYEAKIAGYEAQDSGGDADEEEQGSDAPPDTPALASPANSSPAAAPSTAAGEGLLADLTEVLGRMDREQLKAVRSWATAHGLPIAPDGRPDLAALPADRLEALYTQVAAAA